MVEQMYEFSPEFFRKSQKHYRYFTCKSLPSLTTPCLRNFAYALHSSDEFCHVTGKHYHVLVHTEGASEFVKTLTSKLFPVPCPLTCFKILIFDMKESYVFGDVLQKMQEAIRYLITSNRDVFTNSLKKLPTHSMKTTSATQTDALTYFTLQRVEQLLNGEMALPFYKIMDILSGGYGSFYMENSMANITFQLDPN